MDYWGGPKGMMPPPPKLLGGGLAPLPPPLPTPMPDDDRSMSSFIIGDDAFLLRTSWLMKPFRPRGYKTFFMLNSVEHEILNAHKYKNIKKFGLFKAQLSLECYFPHSYMLKCQQLLAF